MQNKIQASVYKTKEANKLHLILGSNELVLAIDSAKIDLKSCSQNDYFHSKYSDISAQIQMLILRTETKLKNEVSTREVEFLKAMD